MRPDLNYENRQPIPRWLMFDRYNYLLNSETEINLVSKNEASEIEFELAKSKWLENKSISFAIEIIARSMMLERSDDILALEASRFLASEKHSLNPLVNELIDLTSDNNMQCCFDVSNYNNINYNSNISHIRRQLSLYPHDAISWVEMAWNYSVCGFIQKADRCMKIALSLNSTNPYIVRSAVRFFLHLNDHERAMRIIYAAPNIFTNPLLLSTEISVCEAIDRSPKGVRKAREIINSGRFSKSILTETCSALSTLEFNSGNNKLGRRYLEQSLISPNENTLAQAQYMSKRVGIDYPIHSNGIPCAFEVEAWNAYDTHDYELSLKKALAWHNFQPFSSRPVALSSYISAAIFGDHSGALEQIDSVLRASPVDPNLLNNKAFSLIYLDKYAEASAILESLDVTQLDTGLAGIISATEGLLNLKLGNHQAGIDLYNKAIAIFEKDDDYTRLSRALYFFGKELLAIDETYGISCLKRSYAIANKNQIGDVTYLFHNSKIGTYVLD